jgi:hypothetical protein
MGVLDIRRRRGAWPLLPYTTVGWAEEGSTVIVRTRSGGTRTLVVRIIRESTGSPFQLPSQRDRRMFIIGHDARGICHKAWLDDVVARAISIRV